MATNYYRAAFDSDIFCNKQDFKQSSNEKPSFNSKTQSTNDSSKSVSYNKTDSKAKDALNYNEPPFNTHNILNEYQSNVPNKQKHFKHKSYLSRSQAEIGNYDKIAQKATKDVNRTVEKCSDEKTAHHRKMEEFYGKDSFKHSSSEKSNYAISDIDYDPFGNHKALKGKQYSSAVCLSQPSNASNKVKGPIKRIQVTKREANGNENANTNTGTNAKSNQIKAQQPFEQRVNFLKSNIFHDPDIAMINSIHNVPIKEKKIDTHVIKSSKRPNSAEMDMIFDWKESKNNIWLSKYGKGAALLSAKERKLNEIYGSLDHIDIQNAKEPVLKQFYESRKDIESKALEHFQGTKQDSIKKQVENMSSLNGTDFYQKNYQLNMKKAANANSNSNSNEIVHSFEIDNIHESDIKQVKKYFINNGIHVYDAELHDFNMNSSSPWRISVKIRENANDQTFQKKLIKAKEALKKEKNLELKTKMKPTKSYINSIPQTIKWNDVNVEPILKNRYEDSTDERTHIKGYGNGNKKDNKVTSIPYDLRYKNTFSINFFK